MKLVRGGADSFPWSHRERQTSQKDEQESSQVGLPHAHTLHTPPYPTPPRVLPQGVDRHLRLSFPPSHSNLGYHLTDLPMLPGGSQVSPVPQIPHLCSWSTQHL